MVQVIIVGGGIAGATLAHALAMRGKEVTVLEAEHPAKGSSGNPAGVLFPQFGKRASLASEWHLTSYRFMLHQLEQWQEQGHSFSTRACGMVRIPRVPEDTAQFKALQANLGVEPELAHWVDAAEASDHLGLAVNQGGLYLPQGTWVATPELVRSLLTHSAITVMPDTEVVRLKQANGAWQCITQDERVFTAEHCCLATSHRAQELLPDFALRLHAVGGQISLFNASDVAAPLKAILCYKGYIIPMGDQYLIGATYNHGPGALAVTDENHAKNIADIAQVLPDWIHGAPVSGRTSLRSTTPDRLPYAGGVQEGLWINVGHGSRGLLSAPLCAELMASTICNEPAPFNAAFMGALNPHRFS